MYYIIIQLIESVLPDIIILFPLQYIRIRLYIIVNTSNSCIINSCHCFNNGYIVMPPQAIWLMSIHYDGYITLYCHMHYNV
jgi:hypothetical protein